MSSFCPFCPDAIYDGNTVKDADIKYAIDAHMAIHEHFTFSCAICQKTERTSPIFITWSMFTSHLKDHHDLKYQDFLKSTIFPVDFRQAKCKICRRKLFCIRSSQVRRHLASDHNLDLDEREGAKNFDLGCRLCELSFTTFEAWEKHFVKGKLCPKMPKDQPDVPIGHRSEEFYQEDLRQQNLAKAFSIPERSLTIKPSTYRCKFCDVFSSSQVDYDIHCRGRRHQLNMKNHSSSAKPAREIEPSKGLSQFYCLLCQVYTSGEDCCRQHLAGKKHLAEVARREGKQPSSTFVPMLTMPCFDCDLIFDSVQKYDDHMKGRQHKKMVEGSSSRRSSTPADFLEDETKSKDARYTCDICQVISSGKVDFEMHMSGKNHRENAARVRDDGKVRPRIRPVPAANFISRALGTRSKSPISSTPTSIRASIPSMWRTDDPSFFCVFCQMSFKTGDEWQNHFTSGQLGHEIKMRKATADVFCDICKIGDIPRDSFEDHILSSAHLSVLKEYKKPEKFPPGSFFCDLCFIYTKTLENIQNHYDGVMHYHNTLVAPKTVKMCCSICRIREIKIDKFRPHLQSVKHLEAVKELKVKVAKPERKGLSCDCCCESFKTANDLQRHFESETHSRKLVKSDTLQLTCDICHTDNISRKEFKDHVWSTRHCNWLTKSGNKRDTINSRCSICEVIVDDTGFFHHLCKKEHAENLKLFTIKNAFSGEHLVPDDNEDEFIKTGRCPICYVEYGSFSSHISKMHLLHLFRCRACPTKGGVLHLSQIREHFDKDHPDVEAQDRILVLPQLLAFHICPKCHDVGDITKGIFTMNWTSGESGSHLYKIHSGQTFEERCMKVSCRVCQTIFDDVSAYERHICAIFFREKFNVDFKTLDDFLALKDDREATGASGATA